MRESARNLLVGTVGIVSLVGLVALLILFGELDAMIHPRYEITLLTDHAAGLRRGSSVELNGVPIGNIDDVEVVRDARFPVRVRVSINQETPIPIGAVPFSTSSLLGGPAVLEIQAPPPGDTVVYLPQDGTAIIESNLKYQMLEQITEELDARMAPVLATLARFDEFSATYVEVGQNLNLLLAPQSRRDLEAGASPNLATTIGRLYDVVDDTQEALGLARSWLGDEQLRADALSAIEKANTLIDRATDATDRFARLAGVLETNTTVLVDRFVPLADDLGETLAQVRLVTAGVADGEGTLGQLATNPDLYRSLEDAAIRLEATLREIQLFIQKVKAEGLPVVF